MPTRNEQKDFEKDVATGDDYLEKVMKDVRKDRDEKNKDSSVEDGQEKTNVDGKEESTTKGEDTNAGVDLEEDKKPTEVVDEGADDGLVNLDDLEVEVKEEGKEPAFDFGKLNELTGQNFDSIDAVGDYLNGVKKTQTEEAAKALESDKEFSDLPEDMQEAIKIAQNKGDYKEFLGVTSVDYDKIDPISLYEEKIKSQFGVERQDMAERHLESMTDEAKVLGGIELRDRLKTQNAEKLASIKTNATAAASQSRSAMKDALNGINNVGGFKMSPAYKQLIGSAIENGEFDRNNVKNQDGSIDYNKTIKSRFYSDNSDKIEKYIATKARNDQKREMIDSNTNASVTGSKSSPTPGDGKEKLKGMDLFIQEQKDLNAARDERAQDK